MYNYLYRNRSGRASAGEDRPAFLWASMMSFLRKRSATPDPTEVLLAAIGEPFCWTGNRLKQEDVFSRMFQMQDTLTKTHVWQRMATKAFTYVLCVKQHVKASKQMFQHIVWRNRPSTVPSDRFILQSLGWCQDITIDSCSWVPFR